MTRDELAYALYIVATQNDVPGLYNSDDNTERENLFVFLIRRIKEDADMPTERERAERDAVATITPTAPHGISLAFRFGIASQIINAEQRNARNRPAGMTFFRSRPVRGLTVRLKWAV